MPIYEYKCGGCDQKYALNTTIADDRSRAHYEGSPCLKCEDDSFDAMPRTKGWLVRVYSFARIPGMEEHWNHAVGQPISSMGQFRSELAKKSDEMAERLGMPVNFQPVDWQDKETFGVTEEGRKVYDHSMSRGGVLDEAAKHHPSSPEARTVIWLAPLPAPSPMPD